MAHLRTLVVRSGATEAIGKAVWSAGTVAQKIESICEQEPDLDLIFVHRDADGPAPDARIREIAGAAEKYDKQERVVPVVPVQELESWLLTDESAIRTVVGNPKGRTPVSVPSVTKIPSTRNAKEVLAAACADASGTSGRRLAKVNKSFNRHRAVLLERLDIDGSINELESWGRLVADIEDAVARLSET
ncbi:DUF4276 family protein [Rhodococcus hoagii]|nr:DUF4276 family protein [Prescottella equi]